MTCAGVRRRLSEWLDGELEPLAARSVSAHLAGCPACSRRAEELRAVSGLLAELPRVESREPVESQVALRLELASGARRPALAVLFRGVAAARPLILPSLFPALCLLLLVFGAILALDSGPLPEVRLAPGAWGVVPASGTEGNPLMPSAEVLLPQQLAALALSPEVLAGHGEGSVFFETVVARDGSVAGVTLLQGDSGEEQQLVEALRQQRFEPVRFRGRFVAVSVYRLISRMEVRSPRT
jgi:anti-sigma factor RsiW